jgi:hypothetical protein
MEKETVQEREKETEINGRKHLKKQRHRGKKETKLEWKEET